MNNTIYYSPVKINLTLRVLEKLENGYHNIYSLFLKKKGIEGLTIHPRYGENIADILKVTGAEIKGENLITKTLAYFRTRGYNIPPLNVELRKEFPMGSGIGAGSGNAAALISWLKIKYSLDISLDEISTLGSDIAFLSSENNMSIVTGIGEKLMNVDRSIDLSWGLVFPEWGSSTPKAYSKLDKLRSNKLSEEFNIEKYIEEATVITENLSKKNIVGLLPNDFYSPLRSAYPQYKMAEKIAEKSNLLAWGLCGSGSSYFVLSDNIDVIKETMARFSKEKWVKQTTILE
ncbi:MAG: hypothetical protein RRZ70_03775 [Synergistaceae bacterium]